MNFVRSLGLKIKKITVIGCLFFLLSSCTCGVPLRVTAIQRSDKKLACKDIILEINEAEHYRNAAAQEQAIGLGESLMPLCWVSGFVDGEEAIKKANARIEYLGHIYDLMDCGGKGQKQPLPQTPAPKPIIVPMPQPPAPRPQPEAIQLRYHVNGATGRAQKVQEKRRKYKIRRPTCIGITHLATVGSRRHSEAIAGARLGLE